MIPLADERKAFFAAKVLWNTMFCNLLCTISLFCDMLFLVIESFLLVSCCMLILKNSFTFSILLVSHLLLRYKVPKNVFKIMLDNLARL